MPKQPKAVSVVIVGSGRILDVDINPGATTRDTLEKLNLTGELTVVGDPTPLGPNDNVYKRVEDGDKLNFKPITPVAIG
jgi:hypothetical protein